MKTSVSTCEFDKINDNQINILIVLLQMIRFIKHVREFFLKSFHFYFEIVKLRGPSIYNENEDIVFFRACRLFNFFMAIESFFFFLHRDVENIVKKSMNQ